MDETTPDGRASQGKISRLAAEIRAELNRRLYAGETAVTLLPWLNSVPEVQKVLTAEFEGVPISDNNLSRWRRGGYQEWLKRRERLDHTRELSAYAAKLAQASGGTIAEGAASIASGKILELLEAVEDATGAEVKTENEDGVPDAVRSIQALTESIVSLRAGEIEREKVAQKDRELKRKDQELLLAREKFQTDAAGIALKVLSDARAKEIEGSSASNAEKIQMMGKHLFGDLWAGAK